jgi:hypothetical protein
LRAANDHMNEQPSFRIAPVRTTNDLASTVKLFRAYASSLDVDLSYQNFEAEMQAMPGQYVPRLVNCCLPAIPRALRWVVLDSGLSSLTAAVR